MTVVGVRGGGRAGVGREGERERERQAGTEPVTRGGNAIRTSMDQSQACRERREIGFSIGLCQRQSANQHTQKGTEKGASRGIWWLGRFKPQRCAGARAETATNGGNSVEVAAAPSQSGHRLNRNSDLRQIPPMSGPAAQIWTRHRNTSANRHPISMSPKQSRLHAVVRGVAVRGVAHSALPDGVRKDFLHQEHREHREHRGQH